MRVEVRRACLWVEIGEVLERYSNWRGVGEVFKLEGVGRCGKYQINFLLESNAFIRHFSHLF